MSSASYVNVFSGPLRPVSPRLPKTASSTADDDAGRIPSWTIDGKRRPPPLYPKSSKSAANLKRFEQPQPVAQQQQQCPSCLAATSGDFSAQQDYNPRDFEGGLKIRGIDTLTVFCIATSSFLVGVLLMAGLCYVHKITEPKKFPNGTASCHKPLVDLQHRSLLSSSANRFYSSGNNNNVENTVSTNCAGGDCCSDVAAPPAYSANSVLLMAKPKLKLPCCYDPVDQNDESSIERRPTDGKRPLICDKINQKA
uniref:Uncharacterized protein n=1 Tax=Romanomermis culicivorax TaxID=13658 RepID=A0A915IBU3_ROMCU